MSDTKLRTPCSKESHGKWEADDTSGLIGRSQAGIANCHHPHPEGPSTAEQLIDGGEARGSGGPETISETRGPARQETAEARPPAQNLQGESHTCPTEDWAQMPTQRQHQQPSGADSEDHRQKVQPVWMFSPRPDPSIWTPTWRVRISSGGEGREDKRLFLPSCFRLDPTWKL